MSCVFIFMSFCNMTVVSLILCETVLAVFPTHSHIIGFILSIGNWTLRQVWMFEWWFNLRILVLTCLKGTLSAVGKCPALRLVVVMVTGKQATPRGGVSDMASNDWWDFGGFGVNWPMEANALFGRGESHQPITFGLAVTYSNVTR